MLRQPLPEALEIVQRLFALVGAAIEWTLKLRGSSAQPSRRTMPPLPAVSQPSSTTTRAVRAAEIGLLDALERLLDLSQAPLVVGEVDRRKAPDVGEVADVG